jgi:hypothetical protein
VLRLDPGALVQREPLRPDQRADGLGARARIAGCVRVGRRDQFGWHVAAVGGGGRPDVVQVRAALGEQGDPAGSVVGALAEAGRMTADHQRARRVDQVANCDLMAEHTGVGARQVPVATPRGHVLDEVTDYPVG